MKSDFLLYGSTGFVGSVIARRAVASGLRPLLASRSGEKVKVQAEELDLEYMVFGLEDRQALDEAVDRVGLVLHCAGPYIHTFEPMVEACLRQRAHYLDITGEIPVLEQLVDRDTQAKEKGVMIMPAVGFDVVATDCLTVHLKQRLPSATQLTLAIHGDGPAGMPPGTARTSIEMLPYGIRVRRDGRLVPAPQDGGRKVDFGNGPRRVTRITWGDLVTAYHSTGIRNIETYIALPRQLASLLSAVRKVKSVFKVPVVRRLARLILPAGSTPQERAMTKSHVWVKVKDGAGRSAVSRLHGPEGGVEWTSRAALAAVDRALAGEVELGFQTPGSVYGPDFVFDVEGVRREDLPLSGPAPDASI
ncbi:MAG: saccharopine dehydrogenase family protein [Anaerolineales bacterium]